jgi:hypothetical protein
MPAELVSDVEVEPSCLYIPDKTCPHPLVENEDRSLRTFGIPYKYRSVGSDSNFDALAIAGTAAALAPTDLIVGPEAHNCSCSSIDQSSCPAISESKSTDSLGLRAFSLIDVNASW